MARTQSSDPTVPLDSSTPRVLLFGHPGSGKSSLLGALLRASETQADVLGVEVVDPTRRLNLIRDHLYGGSDLESTRTEIVAYPVLLRTRVAGRLAESHPVVLLDCDGTAANALLKHPDPITERTVRGTIATAVVKSDLLALVVNAGADDAELDAAFEEFMMFLERVHGRKAFEREVGGFPIFLILAQCDQLAEPGDTRAKWEDRVRGNRRHALLRFAEFLEDGRRAAGDDSPYLPFGSVDLHGYAVAVRWPKLRDEPKPPDEPVGVAELFHDAFAAARAHADRARASHRRLVGTVWAVAFAVWTLIAGALAVSIFQPAPADPGLADRVRAFEEREPPAAVRLAEKNIARNKRVLTGFTSDPGYFALPEDLREFVSGRLQEIEDYREYRKKLGETTAPVETRTLEELARVEAVLNTDLALPPRYTWGETEAARLRDKWLADIPLIRAAENDWQEWYRGRVNEALALTTTRAFDGAWRGRVDELDAKARQLPFNLSEPIPGSAAVAEPRGEPVTYRVPAEFDRVYQAHRDWEFARLRLLHLRDLADALGLTADPGDPARRALDLPPPGPGVDSLALPRDRLAALRRHFPRPSELYPALENNTEYLPFPEWELSNFPDPGRAVLAARVRESAANAARHVGGLVLARLGTPPATGDTPEGWLRIADALNEPVFRDWGRVLHLLARMENAAAPDPVPGLAAFLRVKEFTLDVKGFELAVPLALRVPALVPAGPVTVTVTPAPGGQPVVRTFKPVGEAAQQGLVNLYRFTADQTGAVPYRPGDGFRAELPVRSGDQRLALVWDEGGTRTFQFDRLAREPKLVPATGAAEPATGVTLTPTAGSVVPRVPGLLPEVQR